MFADLLRKVASSEPVSFQASPPDCIKSVLRSSKLEDHAFTLGHSAARSFCTPVGNQPVETLMVVSEQEH